MLETGRRILTWRGMLTLTLLYINRGVDASVITYAMAMALNSICRYFTAWVLWVILHICRKIFFCEFQCDTHHNLYTFRLCFTYNLQDVTQELMDLEEQNRKLMAQVLELEQQKEEENKSATTRRPPTINLQAVTHGLFSLTVHSGFANITGITRL
jgi:hypothetical protein